MKFELPEFKGDYGTDEVPDWIQVIKQVLSSARVPPHARVKAIVSRLRDAAVAWLRSLCIQREQLAELQITIWNEFRMELNRQSLPYKYKQRLFGRLLIFDKVLGL